MARMVLDLGYASTSELAASFGVSEMTVRRDVAKLQRQGRLRNVHGGVTAVPEPDLGGTDFDARTHLHANQKLAVARAALRFLPDDGIIAIDAGTTSSMLVPLLPVDRRFTIVTYSLPVMTQATRQGNVELLNLGGVFHRDTLSYSGPMTIRALENLSISTLFLGTSSISERGLFCGNAFDAVTKRALIDAAASVVLLIDSSKFSKVAVARFCDLGRIDHVIVDDGIQPQSARLLAAAGIEPVVVNGDGSAG